jgi:hypothetical protein
MILDWQYKLKTFLNTAVKDHQVGAWDILLKIVYISLQLLDLEMTLIASQFGFPELNPFIRTLMISPFHLLLIKVGIPLLICLFVPGRFLIPGIALLAGIICWNTKELLVLLF